MNLRLQDRRSPTIIAVGLLVLLLSVSTAAQQTEKLEIGHSQLTDLDIVTARTWGLSETEWLRVQTTRAIRHGLVSDQITPLEVLGIFADNPADRRRYAKTLCRAAKGVAGPASPRSKRTTLRNTPL